MIPGRTDDGDLGPGKKIAVIGTAGRLEATITLPEPLTRFAVDGDTIFGVDIESGLRIFKLERK